MKWFTKGVRGSISLFLSMIILLLVILEGFLIDGSKALAAKMLMSSAGDLAMNAGLTYYDDALRRVYGLFAFCKTEAELKENLEQYFRETLGDSTGSDGTTQYTDQLLQFVQQSITGGWNGEEAGRLLNLSVTSFEASGAEHSSLAEDYVIKNQILEYMKYRGPASLGYGMLEKIFAFKDLSKQQKVMEDKLEYEEHMDEVQQACQDAYTALIAYNTILKRLTPDHVEEESDAINRAIYETVVAEFALNVVQNNEKHKVTHNGKEFDDNWQVKVSGISGHDVEAAFQACTNFEMLKKIYSQGGADANGTFISNLNGNASSRITAAMQAVKLTIGYMEDFEHFKTLYTTWQNWKTYYSERTKELEEAIEDAEEAEEDTNGLEAELRELEETQEKYDAIMNGEDGVPGVTALLGTPGDAGQSGIITVLKAASSMLESDIDGFLSDVSKRLNTIYEDAVTLETAARLAKEKLEEIIAKMEALREKGESWQSSISNLPEGTVKTSMQSDYDNKSRELDRMKIRALENYLENGTAYANELSNEAAFVKVVGFENLYQAQEKSSYALYLRNNWNNSSYNQTTQPYTNRPFQSLSAFVSEWVENANQTEMLTDPSYTVYLLDAWGGQRGSGKWLKMNLQPYRDKWEQTVTEGDEFYQYLERICPEGEAETEECESAKQTKRDLLKKAENVSFEPTGITEHRMSGTGDTKNFNTTGSEADDKTVTKNAKENSKSSANFLQNVGELLKKGRDKLYISEYATEMFSCYTSDLPEGRETPKTLSGFEISQANNYLYKAEAEYILWGNENPKVDVQNTLATIFGVRFLLNMLYAFTGDPEIRSTSLALATSIAGWTGFGVPLVQSVIIIAFALAETALDLEELKKGESIPIYKSSNTWAIKPSGMGRTFKEEVGQAINNSAKKLEHSLFEQMNDLTAAGITEFNDTLTSFSNDKIDDLIDTASAAVLTPVEERLIGLVNVISPGEEDVASAIDEALAGVKQLIDAEPDSLAKTAKQQAVSIMQSSSCKSVMLGAIREVQNRNDLTASQISDRISSALETCRSTLRSQLKGTVSSGMNALTEELKQSIDAENKELQEDVSEKVDQYLMRIDCGVSFAELPSTEDSQKVHTSAADALTMDYSEYVWLFIAVSSVSDTQEGEILRRIGNLIEKNITLGTNPNRTENKQFSMAGAFTFIRLKAQADLRTTFFAMPVPGGNGSAYGPDRISIGYSSVLGY